MTLRDRTLFISGGSRGIGLEIARRAARDGANVALIAKTGEPHPRLPGTVFTAAECAARRRRSTSSSTTSDDRKDNRMPAMTRIVQLTERGTEATSGVSGER
jgi:NAD(P)-dependent dehydrogenase (short-subunit alcohol dehydrogenase family)